MKVYRSDKKGYSFLVALITVAVAAIIVLLKYILEKIEIMYPQLFEKEKSLPEIIIYSIIIAFLVFYLLFALIFLRLWHKSLVYTVTDSEILSESGFFVHTQNVMKLSSIQFVTGISLPFSKISSFNFITAGALGGTLMMMFLSDEDYKEILDYLNTVVKVKDVSD